MKRPNPVKKKKLRKYQIIVNWRKMHTTIDTVEKITVLLQRKPHLVEQFHERSIMKSFTTK